MQAEHLLRIAADPNAVTTLTSEDLRALLAEARPPRWVFEEAARRTDDERVMAHLFSHPVAKPELLRQAVRYDLNRFERLNHNVAVVADPPPTLKTSFNRVIPEIVNADLTPSQEHLLVTHLSPPCLVVLRPMLCSQEACTLVKQQLENVTDDLSTTKLGFTTVRLPRKYAPFARFLLLGDFLHHLTCARVETPRDLPVLAKVALALNGQQPLTPYLEDADVRVRIAAKERERWNAS